jgi:hypothetical protein
VLQKWARYGFLWTFVCSLKSKLKGEKFYGMETVEHNATEQLLVIPKLSLRGASSIGRNGGTSAYVL